MNKCGQYKFKALSQYIENLPFGVPVAALKRVVCPQFNVSEKQLYYILNKMKHKAINTDELVHQLEQDGYEISISDEPRAPHQPPQMLIITNQEMKSNFSRWGNVVSFDLTFNLVKDIHRNGGKWKIGFFLSLSPARHIVPLAIVATLQSTKEAYIRILKTFFKSMQAQPSVFVTDEEKSMLAAIQELRSQHEFSGLHLLDPYHILHNIRKKLIKKEKIVLFSRIVHAKNDAEFQMLCQQAKSKLTQQQTPLLQRFVARSHLYCFSRIPSLFFGFCSSTSFNQCLHSALKRIQPLQKHYSVAIKNCLRYSNELNKASLQLRFELNPIQNILQIAQLKAIRMLVCKVIMGKIMEQIAMSMRIEVLESLQEQVIIKENHYIFKVFCREMKESLEQKTGRWECNCGYTVKVELPCRHILKTILSRKQPILPYISNRWKLPADGVIQNHKARGREKNSSRHLHL